MRDLGRVSGRYPSNIQYQVECRVCGRWMAVPTPGSRLLAHYSQPALKPGQPAVICMGSGQPGIVLFAEMKPTTASTAARKLADRWR